MKFETERFYFQEETIMKFDLKPIKDGGMLKISAGKDSLERRGE